MLRSLLAVAFCSIFGLAFAQSSTMTQDTEYLVGIMYHEPESFALWNKGVIEDYESTTGLFVRAATVEEAVKWGDYVGQQLLRFVNNDPQLQSSKFGYQAWYEPSIEKSGWQKSVGFFQHVKVGEMPNLKMMTSDAFAEWSKQRNNSSFHTDPKSGQ